MKKIKSKFAILFFVTCLFAALLGPALVFSETSPAERIVAESREKINLAGFIPLDNQSKYEFKTVDSAKEVIEQLIKKEALIGFLNPRDFLKAKEKGIPLVVLSCPFQSTPVTFAIKKNVFLRSYDDLKGKSVLYEPGTIGEILFRHFLRAIRVSYQDLNWMKHDPSTQKDFNGADIVILDKFPEIVKFETKPELDFFIYPHEFNIHFKGPLLVTTEDIIENYPAGTKRLKDRALRNFKSNIFNRKNIYSLFLQKSIPFVYEQGGTFGEITEKDWWQMERLLLEEAELDNPVSLDGAVVVPPTPAPSKSDPFFIALGGMPSADFAGVYMAKKNGYFDRFYPNIILQHLPSETDVLESVRVGQSLVGVASSFSILEAQSKDPNFVLLGVIYQKDPTVFISIRSPQYPKEPEPESRSLFLSESAQGAYISMIRPTALKKGDVEIEKIYPTLFALVDGRAQAVSGRKIFGDRRIEPYQGNFEVTQYHDFAVPGLSIFTSLDNYRKNHDLVRNLVKAIFHGYENCVFQTRDASRAVVDRDGSLSYVDVFASLEENKNYLKDENGIIGTIQPDRWQTLAQAGLEKGFIDNLPNYDRFFPEEVQKKQKESGVSEHA